MIHRPQHPIYVVSKGRWGRRLTSNALEIMKMPYRIVVEQAEYDSYAAVIDPAKILVLPQRYLDDYDTCDDLGGTKSKGPGAARNFCWDHAIGCGATSHWVMDDNIDMFHRLLHNVKVRCDSPAIFAAAEDFVARYENVPLAGFNYSKFAKAMDVIPPYVLNTRIYSCLLIRNDLKHRWRGRYNEDTDLSLRVLKDGDCTIQFNAFLADKVTTQRMGGGNTAEFYAAEGTVAKSEMLARLHPDVTSVVWKFSRWHHHVTYKPFRRNELRLKAGVRVPVGVNNYGLVLRTIA